MGERAEALWLWRGRETAVERKSVRIVPVYCSKYIYGKEMCMAVWASQTNQGKRWRRISASLTDFSM